MLVVDLKRSLRDPGTTDDTRTLLERMRRRRDLFACIGEEIDELLGSRGKASKPPARVSKTEPPSREPSKAEKKPSVAEKTKFLVTEPASTRVSVWTTLRSRLVTSLCGVAIGFTFVAIAVFISGNKITQKDWLQIALPFGSIPWAIAGAITDKNRRVIALALAVAAIGVFVVWAIDAIIGGYQPFLDGTIFGGAYGVILGAILGVILERSRS